MTGCSQSHNYLPCERKSFFQDDDRHVVEVRAREACAAYLREKKGRTYFFLVVGADPDTE